MLSVLVLLSSAVLAQDEAPPPIIGGEMTADFAPVGTLLPEFDGYLYGDYAWCSGTLIDERWVLTAAHCIDDAAVGDLLRYGATLHFCTGTELTNEGVEDCAEITDLIPHPDYSSRDLSADIGLVQLGEGMAASGSYAINDDAPQGLSQDSMTYVGWGSDSYYNGPGSGVKRTVEVRLYDYDSTHLFTYEAGKNVCSGDSGGAALMWDGGAWELVGVNSYVFAYDGGDACSSDQALGASTRVDVYYDWIASTVELSDDGGSNDGGNNSDGGGNSDGSGEDTAAGDTAEPVGGGGGGDQVAGGGGDAGGVGCAVVSRGGGAGLLGLSLLGLALGARRRQR